MKAVVALALAWLAACHPEPTVAGTGDAGSRVIFITSGGEVPVLVEIADSPAEQRRGLMFRKELAADHGMLFTFAIEEEHPFWMKNTYIPLDMIFVDAARKVVGVVANAEPLNETALTVGKPSKYVVEVNAGFAAKNGIGEGASASFDIPESPAPPIATP